MTSKQNQRSAESTVVTEVFPVYVLGRARDVLRDEPDAFARLEEDVDEKVVATAVEDCVHTLDLDFEMEGLTTTTPESLQEICEHVVGTLVTRARVPH
jgi:acetyl esterase/lipase